MKKIFFLLYTFFAVTLVMAQTDLATLTQKANQGDAEAQFDLAKLYFNGSGVSQSYTEAVKWYRKSAEQGFARAQNNLGICYLDGEGVPQSNEEGVRWITIAAEQGFAPAQYNLAALYDEGSQVTQSYAEAVKWYRKSAEQGYAHAQNNLGTLYRTGKGVPQSNEECVRWVTMAAKQGHELAQYNLGCYYKNGTGVAKSEAEAARWFRKAASQGDKDAKNELDAFNRSSSIEYYMLYEGGGLVSLTKAANCYYLTSYANGQTASLAITITGRADNGACVYSVQGTNTMFAASDSEHSYLLLGSPNTQKYERYTPAEAAEVMQREAQIYGATSPAPSIVNGYGTNSGTSGYGTNSSTYVSVGSASATVISSGYGNDTSWTKSVEIYRKDSSYYIKIGGSYYRLSPNSNSTYLGHSTNGANYSAMINSSFYFVSIN